MKCNTVPEQNRMNHYVYEITNLVNGKKYIGKRSCSCPTEEDKYMGSGTLLKKSIEKYGINNFKKEVLKICENEQMAFEWEKVYIEQVKAYDSPIYYNIHFGGNGFTSDNVKELWQNQEYRQKISESRKQLWKNNEFRHKEIQRRRDIGKSIEFKEKVSNASKANWENEDYRRKQLENLSRIRNDKTIQEKRINSLKGRVLSDETIEKIRVSNIGKNLGLKSSLSKPIICINNQQIFESTRIAGKKFNCDNSSISKSCNNVLKLSCGKENGKRLFWMKLEDFNKLNEVEKLDLITKAQNYKYEMSLEQKQSISTNMKKRSGKNHTMATKIICLNTLEIFDYIKQATEKYGINNTCIANCCKGKQKYAGKIKGEPAKWMYYEDYLKSI
ncbi:hypothetical protein UT300012_26450 [Paraclostridium bifermentans]